MTCSGPTDVLVFDLPPDFGSWDVSFDLMSDMGDLSVTVGSSDCEVLDQNACFDESMPNNIMLMPGQYYVYVRSQGSMPGPYELTLNATGM